MKQFTLLFFVFFLSITGYSQGSETFTNLSNANGDGNGNNSSYQGWTWIGDNGSVWSATDARTDESINGSAIVVRNGNLSTTLTGGIGDLTLTTQRFYGGGSGIITVSVNGEMVGAFPYDSAPQTSTVYGINVSGDVVIVLETPGNGNRIGIDDLVWTAASDGVFDCPSLLANIGDSCDDGNANTENDIVTEDCDCAGTPIVPSDLCGLETFDNAQLTSSYADGSFVGNDGITWTYVASRDENSDTNNSGISGNAIMLRRVSDGSRITSSVIPGGISDFSVKLYKGFTGNADRQAELFVNGVSQGLSQAFNDFEEHIFTVTNIDIEGDVIIEIRNATSGQLIVDDISWTCGPEIIFECPELEANIGDVCNDGDANTENDVVTEDCECVGTPIVPSDLCGLETFDNAQLTSNYTDGSFVGNDGITWTYVASRDENSDTNNSGISGNAIMLRRLSDDSKITSSAIQGGISDFSVKLYKGFTGNGNRQAELFVNGVSQGLSQAFNDFEEHVFTVTDIDIAGDVIIEIRNATNNQLIIDDISWTCGPMVIYDCPELEANFGDSCDDGNSNTINDTVNENCECVGEPTIPASEYFVTTWTTTTANETITIPTSGSGYDYLVEWGDGSSDTGMTGNATHSYAEAGTYTVKIHGDFPRIFFNLYQDRQKIQSIEQWGNIQWTSMNSAFMGATNLVSNATDMPDLSLVTDMYGMFGYTEAFNGDSGMGAWDVSNVTNMYGMFGGAFSFNADISNWDVGNVRNMKLMFSHAYSFNQDIGNWDVGSVTNMDSMFRVSSDFDQDLGAWNVSNVVNMTNMLKDVTLSTANYDALLNGWNTLTLKNNVKFHAGNSTYCNGEIARQNIIATYNWTITDSGMNCDDEDILNIEHNERLANIVLYPNPMRNKLILGNPKNVQLDSASIYDLTGRLITTVDLKGMAAEMELDVTGLSSATYMVIVNVQNGGQVTKLMVKE